MKLRPFEGSEEMHAHTHTHTHTHTHAATAHTTMEVEILLQDIASGV